MIRKIIMPAVCLLMLLLCLPRLAYADSAEDPNYIVVEKTFSGLPEKLIPEDFRITVSSDGGAYTLNKANTLSRSTDAAGDILWRWKITGVGIGSYTVTEAGEEAEGYTVTPSGAGTVEVRAAEMSVLIPVHETTCSHTNWPVRMEGDSNVLFAATLTQGGVAVISEAPLSASQRAAVAEAVLKINGPWKNPVYFYSVEEQIQNKKGFELNGATITYRADTEEIIIGRTRNWQHIATLQYSLSAADDPEIALQNAYARATGDVTIQKAVAGNLGDREKPFSFTVSVSANGAAADFTLNGAACTGSAAFTLKDGESVHLADIPVGARLTVEEAESGYAASCAIDGAEAVTGRSAVIEGVTGEGHFVLFTNRKDAVPDTGVHPDTLPYALLLVLAAGGMMLRRRRHE